MHTNKIEEFTPAKAEDILITKNPNNRKVSQPHVRALADQMVKGHWKLNGETIKFDPSGNLLDGQHRLRAIIVSGKTVPIEVSYGVDPNCWETIDRGRKRSNADAYRMHGFLDSAFRAAVINHFNREVENNHDNASYSLAEEIYNRHIVAFNWLFDRRSQFEAALSGVEFKTLSRWLFKAGIGSALVRGYEYAPEATDKFLTKLVTGAQLEQYDAAKILRECLMNLGSRQSADNLFGYTLSALFRDIHNKPMKNVSPAGYQVRLFFKLP